MAKTIAILLFGVSAIFFVLIVINISAATSMLVSGKLTLVYLTKRFLVIFVSVHLSNKAYDAAHIKWREYKNDSID